MEENVNESMKLVATLVAVTGTLFLILIGVIGFFLRTLHKDLRDNIKKTNEQEGRLDIISETHKQEIKALRDLSDTKLDNLKDTTELQIGNMASSVDNLTKTLGEHIKTTEKRMLQKDNTTELLTTILSHMTKEK